jgi:tetratricopeptide (TPR) repeat protein
MSDALPTQPLDPDVALLLSQAQAFLRQGELERALDHFSEVLRRKPDNLDALCCQAEAWHLRDEYDLAFSAFDRLVSLRPEEPRYYLGRARAHFEKDRNDETIADCDMVLQLRPGHIEARCYRAAAIHCAGDNETAIDLLTEVLRDDPVFAPAYFYRGRALYYAGDSDAALEDFNRAVLLDPRFPWAYWFRPSIFIEFGETDKARADYDTAVRLKPHRSDVYQQRSYHWLLLDDLERALADAEEAIRRGAENVRLYYHRMTLREMLDDEAGADADFETIAHLQSKDTKSDTMPTDKLFIYTLVQDHFRAAALEAIRVTERFFPHRVGADLQLALDGLGGGGFEVHTFYAVHHGGRPPQTFQEVYTKDRRNPVTPVPPQYAETDVGEDQPVRCLKDGLWLLDNQGAALLVLLYTEDVRGIHVQIAAHNDESGQQATGRLFLFFEEAIQRGQCYRGKVLSLEQRDMYSGQSLGILVHKLRPVERDQVILPQGTLDLLERNVIQFIRQRPRLAQMGLATKKGLLFYGPPGTGKTHTIHYLTRSVPGQTTFLIAAEQVGLLGEYMTLARLFQPSMVVIEDVDLIARDRNSMHNPSEEALLNKLLNEMDGLRQDADILFILTTNHPKKLEEALASRPGRIDQAIEFPLPDDEGRAKLVRLYSRQVDVPEAVVSAVVKKVHQVSGSFIRELMRRSTQFYLERDGQGALVLADVENALEEMLFKGGSLNRVLLGAVGHPGGYEAERIGFKS